jgi:hypothetical protein
MDSYAKMDQIQQQKLVYLSGFMGPRPWQLTSSVENKYLCVPSLFMPTKNNLSLKINSDENAQKNLVSWAIASQVGRLIRTVCRLRVADYQFADQ